MSANKPTTRTEASEPKETRHLDEAQKQSLDLNAEVEHAHGQQREKLTKETERLSKTP